ncbi:MAG: putative glycoside hydrolase, partial [Acidimicrobiia bacterium]|nr:putative glycoside hydrolase [Acidimicrobiia bacterium]
FDEIQFDYVRFPAGSTAAAAQISNPTTEAERLAAIQGYLAEARSRLHPMGCALSADIFGIVLSAPNDQGIGQRPEEVSQVVDAVSPMVYPSHYSNGWLGFEDPNDHPGPVTADALDDGTPRLIPPSLMRPWLQAFWWPNSQIAASIAEAEKRGVGWILWNAAGNYGESALPAAG